MAFVSATQGIREEIASRLNEIETDNTDIYNNWINLTLRNVANAFPNMPLIQTSADYTLSSGVAIYNTGNLATFLSAAEKVNTITLPSTQTKLQFYSPEEFDLLFPSASQGGNPTVFTIRGYLPNGNTQFYPVPGNSITIHADFERSMDTVSAGSSTPGLPTKYYELLVLGGEMRGLRRQKRYDLASEVDKDYQVMLQLYIQDLLRQTSQMPRIKSVREFRQGTNMTTDPIQVEFFSNQF